MEIKTYKCDIKGCKGIVGNHKEHPGVQVPMQVIFTTEQNEGRSTKPYFETIKLDLCDKCFSNTLNGNYIFASGAMGHNEYYFRR